MVFQQEKSRPVSNGYYVKGVKSNNDSPTFSCDVYRYNEKRSSKISLTAHAVNLAVGVPFANSTSTFVGNEGQKCDNTFTIFKKKAVHFMADPCDSQKVECRSYETIAQQTNFERKMRWYKSSDIKRMRNEAQHAAIEARSNAQSYRKQFQQLHTSCNATVCDESSACYLRAHAIAASPYRGMENLIFIETLRINQRRIVLEVLAAQEDFRDLLSPEELTMELQSQSTKLTQCSSRLARMMGIGDEEACQVTTPLEQELKVQLNPRRKVKIEHRNEANHNSASTLYEI